MLKLGRKPSRETCSNLQPMRQRVFIKPDDRFGSLVAVARASVPRYWTMKCDCGTSKDIYGPHLTRGKIVSCGCFVRSDEYRESQRITATRHGHGAPGRHSLTYETWSAMNSRCRNPGANRKWYFDAGVRVCGRWEASFEAFLTDMGERPSKAHTIDRIDPTKDYEPGNCRWATWDTQARNRRNTKLTECLVLEIRGRVEHGESQSSVARRIGVSKTTVSNVIAQHIWREIGQ